MGLTDYLGKKRRLMIVKEVEFGVYLGNKDDNNNSGIVGGVNVNASAGKTGAGKYQSR